MKKLALMLALAVAALPAMAASGDANFKISLWDRIAVGIPNNIDSVTGLDLGIGSVADHVSGVQLDLLYANSRNELTGVQWAWAYTVTPEFTGLQAAIYAKSDNFTGVQSGLVAKNAQDFTGVQWGGVNVTDSFTGVQLGFVNVAKSVKGLQWGFVNYTEDIYGLQVGLLNIARNGWLPAMVIVNGRF